MGTLLRTDRILRFDTSSPTVAATTTLAVAVTTTTQQNFTLSSTGPINGVYIQMPGGERCLVISGGGSVNIVVTRGAQGTTPTTYSIGATVNLPGHSTLNLLQISQVRNQPFTIQKITTDINYVQILTAGSDTFSSGGTLTVLSDNTPSLGQVTLLAPGDGSTVWIQSSGAGATGPAGSPATPAALNLTFTGGLGQLNSAYTGAFTASGGVAPYTFSITSGSLPTGLSLNAGTGAVTGTPTVAGVASFTGTVTDHVGTTANFPASISINGAPTPPSSVLLLEIGPRSIDGNQQTRTVLQVTISESISGTLGTKLTVQLNSNGGGWYQFASIDPSGSPIITGQRVTKISVPNILILTVSQTYQAQAWASNSFADPGQVGAVASSILTIGAMSRPATYYLTSGITGTLSAVGSSSFTLLGGPTTTIVGNEIFVSTANGIALGIIATYNTSTKAGTISAPWTSAGAMPSIGDTYTLNYGAKLTVTNLAGSAPTQANIYAGLNGLGNPYWAVQLSLITPGSGDPNAWYYATWVRWTDSVGNPIVPGGVANTSGWIANRQTPNTGTTDTWQLFENYPGPTVGVAYMQIVVWGISRRITATAAPYTGDVQAEIQGGSLTTWLINVGPPPTGNSTNMLVNPSALQVYSVGWTIITTGTPPPTYSNIVLFVSGSFIDAFQIAAPISGFPSANMRQSFSTRGADSYTFEIWAADPSGGCSADITLVFSDRTGFGLSAVTVNLTGLTTTLQPFSVTGDVVLGAVSVDAVVECSSGTLQFTNCFLAGGVQFPLVKSGNTHTLLVDNTTVGVGPGGLSAAAGGALLNGGFEAGTFVPWTNSGLNPWQISTAKNHTVNGTYSALSNGSLATGQFDFITQSFNVTPGQVIVGKCWIFPDTGATGQAYLQLIFIDASGTQLAGYQSAFITATGSWQQATVVTAVAPSNAVQCLIQPVVGSNTISSSGNWYFDDITVQIIQPGSGVTVDSTGNLKIAYGAGLKDDGTGLAALNTAAPFTYVGPQLDGMTVNGLNPGTTQVTGNYVFQHDASGAFVEIGSAGVIMADNATSPVNTIAVSPSGVSVATYDSFFSAWASGHTYSLNDVVSYASGGATFNYISLQNSNVGHAPATSPTFWALTNAVSVSSSGVGIFGPTSSATITSGGFVVSNGPNSVTVGSSSINLQNGNNSVNISAGSGILIQNSAGPYVQISATEVLINQGVLALNLNNALTTVGNISIGVLTGAVGMQVQTTVAGHSHFAAVTTEGVYSVSDAGTLSSLMQDNGGAGEIKLFSSAGALSIAIEASLNTIAIGGSQVLTTRYSGTPLTLADVIAVLQHHGLSN